MQLILLENERVVLVDNKNEFLYKFEDDLDSDREN